MPVSYCDSCEQRSSVSCRHKKLWSGTCFWDTVMHLLSEHLTTQTTQWMSLFLMGISSPHYKIMSCTGISKLTHCQKQIMKTEEFHFRVCNL